MDVTGINNNMINFSIDNAKEQTKSNEFEKILKKAYNENDEKELKKQCKEFEKVFLNMMYKQMKATVPKAELIENSFASQTFEEMFDEKITEEVAKGSGVGLGDMLYKSLIRDMKATYKKTDGVDNGEKEKTDIFQEKTE